MLLRAGPQSLLRQRLEGGGELVHLNDEVAEPGADLYWPVGRPVYQFERDNLMRRRKAWYYRHEPRPGVSVIGDRLLELAWGGRR
jgi:hypothetical protein